MDILQILQGICLILIGNLIILRYGITVKEPGRDPENGFDYLVRMLKNIWR